MNVDEAEDDLIAKGVPEPVAMDVLEVLGHYGVYEVRVKVPDKEEYYRARCIMQHQFDIDRLEAP